MANASFPRAPQEIPMTTLATAAVRAVDPIVSASDGFETELATILKQSLDARKSLVFHLGGSEVAGVVKEIRHGMVIVSNHEHPRILIRVSRIDAVESQLGAD